MNASYDLVNNTYQDVILQPKSQIDERKAALLMLKRTEMKPTIVTMDRGYCSFNMIENCNRLKNCNYVIRSKTGQGAFKEIQSLPNRECDLEVSCRVTISNYYYAQRH